MPKLLLLDGNSLLYRGFFAMRSLSTASGQPVNAIYSVALMLLTLGREESDAVVCAWDTPEPTFRHIEFPAYKAQRAAPPEDLVAQRDLARDLMSVFNIVSVEAPGWEADDLIGAIAEREKRQGVEVTIVTGDMDSAQLVDDSHGPVRVMSTVKGVTQTVLYNEAAVRERYGLTPRQIPDFKALKGDPSDNIPGVPGIGDKTATSLLSQFGSIENLIEKVDEVKPVRIQSLIRENSELAIMCKRIATICRDFDLPKDFEIHYDYSGPDAAAAKELFEKLEFHSLIRRLPASKTLENKQIAPAFSPSASANHPLEKTISMLSSPQFSLDFDQDEQSQGVSQSISAEAEIVYEPCRHSSIAFTQSSGAAWIEIEKNGDSKKIAISSIGAEKVWLEDDSALKVALDSKQLYSILQSLGIELGGVVFDISIAAYLLNPGRGSYRPLDLAREYLSGANSLDHCAQTRLFRLLEPPMRNALKDSELEELHDKMELPLAKILSGMELRGVAIDSQRLGEIAKTTASELEALEEEIYKLCGEQFTIGSPKQLQVILFEKLGLPKSKKTKTGYSTDSEVLESLAAQGFEVVKKIVQWRELSKIKSQYADALPTLVSPLDGRIHTTLNQTATSTGRLSSSNPNLQNIPIRTAIGRQIRRAFVPTQGDLLLSADYSQMELRLFAHMTKDPGLMRAFAAGEDIHKKTAALVFGVDEDNVTSDQRRHAKTINFAVIYGMGDMRLAAEMGVSRAIASEWKKRYFEGYPRVKEYAESVIEFAEKNGYVKTLLGRRRLIPDINSRVAQFRAAAQREAVNAPVQGSGADIVKMAMIKASELIAADKLDACMILQVHDELLFECAPDCVQKLARLVRDSMETAFLLDDVPLSVDVKVGKNWSEMLSIENSEYRQ